MKDKNIIPKGDYCYTIKRINCYNGRYNIKIIPCSYYNIEDEKCDYLNKLFKNDILLDDMCKICNINIGDEDYED